MIILPGSFGYSYTLITFLLFFPPENWKFSSASSLKFLVVHDLFMQRCTLYTDFVQILTSFIVFSYLLRGFLSCVVSLVTCYFLAGFILVCTLVWLCEGNMIWPSVTCLIFFICKWTIIKSSWKKLNETDTLNVNFC